MLWNWRRGDLGESLVQKKSLDKEKKGEIRLLVQIHVTGGLCTSFCFVFSSIGMGV